MESTGMSMGTFECRNNITIATQITVPSAELSNWQDEKQRCALERAGITQKITCHQHHNFKRKFMSYARVGQSPQYCPSVCPTVPNELCVDNI